MERAAAESGTEPSRYHTGELPEVLQDIYECPPGLEHLVAAGFITINSQADAPEEALLGYDSDYRFEILNDTEDRIFFAGKTSRWGCRHICWRSNSYDINVMNPEGSGVFSIVCKASCCKDVVSVYMEDGLLGKLVSKCKCFPSVIIFDDDGNKLIVISMTSCPCCGCYSGAATFDILVKGTTHIIGRIEKLNSDPSNVTHYNQEHYSISFRKDINIRVKVMLIAALFHIGTRFLTTRYTTLERRVRATRSEDEGAKHKLFFDLAEQVVPEEAEVVNDNENEKESKDSKIENKRLSVDTSTDKKDQNQRISADTSADTKGQNQRMSADTSADKTEQTHEKTKQKKQEKTKKNSNTNEVKDGSRKSK